MRAKTNTYIKTPVRGDEPVFVVDTAKGLTAWLKAEATEEQCFHSAWSYGGVRSLLYHASTAAKN